MPSDHFSDAALVILGHGLSSNDESSRPVFQHAAELRNRRIFREVREAFWKQEPQIKKVLGSLSEPRIFIAPLFISEGWFAGNVIPRELGFSENLKLETSESKLAFCKPIGVHDSMTKVIIARADEVIKKFPFPRMPKPKDVTLFVAGHGTPKNDNSRRAIEHQADLIRSMNLYADVQAIFMEEEPRIPGCYTLAQTRNIVVVPFFIADGMHTQEDIPVLLGEAKAVVEKRLAAGQPSWRNPTERNEKLVWYAQAAGTAPETADVILERVREAAANL